jgi:cytochrome c oxidase cbb3-type subunit 2/cytochrome c oxidase cbb3-type subunit I/II
MPPWNRLGSADLQAVAAYVRKIGAGGRDEGAKNSVIEQGRDLYRQKCTACHGVDGRADGPASAALAPSPANFHEVHPAREYALRVLKNGLPGTAMPPWEAQMTDTERNAVIAYVESLYE